MAKNKKSLYGLLLGMCVVDVLTIMLVVFGHQSFLGFSYHFVWAVILYSVEGVLLGIWWAMWPINYWKRFFGMLAFIGTHTLFALTCNYLRFGNPEHSVRDFDQPFNLWRAMSCGVMAQVMIVGGFFYFLRLCGLKTYNLNDPSPHNTLDSPRLQFTISNMMQAMTTFAIAFGLGGDLLRSVAAEMSLYPYAWLEISVSVVLPSLVFGLVGMAILLASLTAGNSSFKCWFVLAVLHLIYFVITLILRGTDINFVLIFLSCCFVQNILQLGAFLAVRASGYRVTWKKIIPTAAVPSPLPPQIPPPSEIPPILSGEK